MKFAAKFGPCLALIAIVLGFAVDPCRAQEGSSIPDHIRGTEDAVARGILDGNLIEANFRNYTEISETPDVQFGSWPRGTNNRHVDGIGMSVAGLVRGNRAKYPQFYGGLRDTVLNPISMNYFYGRTSSPYGDVWGWLPLPGFHNAFRFNALTGDREPTPALSDDRTSWPVFWPDKLDDPDDPGWCADAVDFDPNVAAWNGFFGKGVMNADLEAFFVVDDLGAYDYHIDRRRGRPFSEFGVFYPDPTDSTKGGLGLQVQMRIFQWANILAEDAMFILYRITNVGQTDYGPVIDLPCFDHVDAAGRRQFSNPCKSGLHMTQFSDLGLGWEETDESSAYDPQLDVAWAWDHDGIGVRPGGGSYRLGVTGYSFLESPVKRDDGLDNDEDGITDEGRFSGPGILIEGRDPIRAYVAANYDVANFERALGPLEEQRAYVAGRWWTGDEDMDWLGFDDKNGNGRHDLDELINDDYGADGLSPNDFGYPGRDTGESDAYPTAGEPNFDQTDIEESDQVGLTGVHLSCRPCYTDGAVMADDTWMWARIIENQFPLGTKPQRAAADVEPWITWNSGPIELAPQQTDFFSTAWLFGWDEEDFLDNRKVVQTIYNADYRFAQPPLLPRLEARAGDGYVVLSWDTLSLSSFDRFTQEYDFEGYKLYRGTDPLLSDARTITDFRGVPTFYQPIAEWDLKNGIRGNTTVLGGEAVYHVGSDTGLEFAYIDRDVVNGRTYYYALVAFDRGFEPDSASPDPNALPIDPQENTFNVSIDQAGLIRGHSINVAIVTPRSRAAGYVPTTTNESLEAPHGSTAHAEPLGTGRIAVNVVNESQLREDALFRLVFHDSSATGGSTYETKAFSLLDRTTGEVLLDRQEISDSSPSVAGLVIDFFNDELDLDASRSGWRGVDGTGQPIVSPDPRDAGLETTWEANVEIDPSSLAKVTSSEFRLVWVDPADSVYTTPRFSSAFPILQIPVFCTNTTTGAACDLIVDDTNDNEAFDAADALIVAEKDCRFCVHGFRFRVTFSPAGQDVSPEPGAELVISQVRPFAEGDYFEFTMAPAHVDEALAREELEQVAVVPNPYVAAAEWEPQTQITGRGPRRVQFIHLPERCTIRIFTIRGELVQELRHEGAGGDGAEWWNLRTRDGQEVAYGVYLFHVESEYGETTGKFAIVK